MFSAISGAGQLAKLQAQSVAERQQLHCELAAAVSKSRTCSTLLASAEQQRETLRSCNLEIVASLAQRDGRIVTLQRDVARA